MNATTSAMPNFGALLDKPSSEVERPKPLPQGTYVAMVQGLPRYDKSTKKQTEYVEFMMKILSAGDDVDAEELASVLGEKPLNEITMKNTYYLTENSLWRLKDFLQHLGFEVDGDQTLRQMIEESAGRQVGIFIKHEPSQDGSSVFAQIGRTLAVE